MLNLEADNLKYNFLVFFFICLNVENIFCKMYLFTYMYTNQLLLKPYL